MGQSSQSGGQPNRCQLLTHFPTSCPGPEPVRCMPPALPLALPFRLQGVAAVLSEIISPYSCNVMAVRALDLDAEEPKPASIFADAPTPAEAPAPAPADGFAPGPAPAGGPAPSQFNGEPVAETRAALPFLGGATTLCRCALPCWHKQSRHSSVRCMTQRCAVLHCAMLRCAVLLCALLW